MKIIKEPMNGLRLILAIIAFVLIVPIISVGNGVTKHKTEYKDLNWSYIVLKDHLPQPEAKKADINSNSDNYLSLDISAKDEEAYRIYIEKCKQFGYTIDAKNYTSSYEAVNNEGYKIYVYYSESSKEYTINLSLNKEEPKKEEPVKETSEKEEQNTEEVKKEETTKESNNEIGTDFKSAMDSYEAFIDEYIAFMKKYSANASDLELIKEYSKYASKYEDMAKKFDKWESEDLNAVEKAYYIEVQSRVNKKLLDASL